jgi:hypothetical protein
MAQETKKYTAEQLIKARARLKELDAEIQRAEGRRTELMEGLKRDFGVSTLEAAEILLKKMDGEIETKSTRLAAGLKQLASEFDWEGK